MEFVSYAEKVYTYEINQRNINSIKRLSIVMIQIISETTIINQQNTFSSLTIFHIAYHPRFKFC